ncbi:MAG: glycosyltransferase family 4 protein [Planctomycetes bacterium]|nr:glycosyltransferase family 4 protein [Planctomycetota bacterium]
MTKSLLKVLHVITRLIPGGAQDNTTLTIEHSRSHGYDAALACAPEPGRVEEVRQKGTEVILVPEFRREISPINDIIALLKLYFIIKRSKFHIVHTHTSKAGVLGRIAARLAGTPIIIHTPHGSFYHPVFFNPCKLWFFSLIERFTAMFTDRIITLCRSETRDYLERGIAGNEKFTVIPSGVDTDKFPGCRIDRDKMKGELGLPKDVPIVGIIARLAPEKGHDLCLDAFPQLIDAFQGALLIIVGKGALEDDIRKKISRLRLDASVVMLGHRTDIPEIIQILDVAVQPSFMDANTRTVVEAMLCGVPVVATDAGGIPEIVKHEETGLLVPPGDAAALARAITRLLKDEDLRVRLAEEAYRRIRQTHSLQTMIDNIFRLYDELSMKADLKKPQITEC